MRHFIAAAIFVVATMVTPPEWVVPEDLGPRTDLVKPSDVKPW
jgi:hypothetical protein